MSLQYVLLRHCANAWTNLMDGDSIPQDEDGSDDGADEVMTIKSPAVVLLSL